MTGTLTAALAAFQSVWTTLVAPPANVLQQNCYNSYGECKVECDDYYTPDGNGGCAFVDPCIDASSDHGYVCNCETNYGRNWYSGIEDCQGCAAWEGSANYDCSCNVDFYPTVISNDTYRVSCRHGVKITQDGEAYGADGSCDGGFNECGDAATCALWACQVNGYSTLVSYGYSGPCFYFSVCNLFYMGDRCNVWWNWGNWCEISGVTDIVCDNDGYLCDSLSGGRRALLGMVSAGTMSARPS
ncbi:hypothetical protein HYH03_013412 [Edaphochlamys debaryana]|uniref:Uncharacterized protein n=1 Tax=Edaphochlamys debaryana TaxID=47281 RepID=A0A835XR05_9CHLO|nr:hypothetical protein HYH03_013412 [Edaphochlamys debaryana]|eukprot:KAG2487972.1 hypothetical protein HYH03_013412 [Edaphochlamys debaryana]